MNRLFSFHMTQITIAYTKPEIEQRQAIYNETLDSPKKELSENKKKAKKKKKKKPLSQEPSVEEPQQSDSSRTTSSTGNSPQRSTNKRSIKSFATSSEGQTKEKKKPVTPLSQPESSRSNTTYTTTSSTRSIQSSTTSDRNSKKKPTSTATRVHQEKPRSEISLRSNTYNRSTRSINKSSTPLEIISNKKPTSTTTRIHQEKPRSDISLRSNPNNRRTRSIESSTPLEITSKNKVTAVLHPEKPRSRISLRSNLNNERRLSNKSSTSTRSRSSSASRSNNNTNHNTHRSKRLSFDGSITSSSPPTSRRNSAPSPQPEQHRSRATKRLSKSNSNSNGSSTHNSRASFDRSVKSSTSNKTSHHKVNTRMSAMAFDNENVEMPNDKTETAGLFSSGGDQENQVSKSAVVADDGEKKSQSSCCTTRKKLCFGSIICVIVIAAVVVPCVLLLGGGSGGSSGNSFPQLSKAGGATVVATVSSDICNEMVPGSGSCTPESSDVEKQGGELCNLVAKSMINTTVYGDIGLINAGICQQDLLAPELTASEIKNAIAAESLVVVQISGADLVNILTEATTTTFAGESGDPQAYPYAAGLRYNVEANLPPLERVSNIEVNRGLRGDTWQPIDIRKFYKVITTKSLANGGMGYASFGNVIDDWKDPLNIETGDAFYYYAMENDADENWSILSNGEYSTQYFIGENEEPTIAVVPTRICHALIPGQPETSSCTAADVANGGEVCNLVSWAIYDQNFGIDMVMLKADACAGDIEEGNFGESGIDSALSENQSLVTVDMLGSTIVVMLEEGISSAGKGDYPYAAGLKFDVNTSLFPSVSNVQVLTSSGTWIPIVGTDSYTIMTTPDVAVAGTGAQDTGKTMKDEIIDYAAVWKTLYKPLASKASTQSYA